MYVDSISPLVSHAMCWGYLNIPDEQIHTKRKEKQSICPKSDMPPTDTFKPSTVITHCSITHIGEVRCLHRNQRCWKDNTQPSHSMFTLLQRYRRLRGISCSTTLHTLHALHSTEQLLMSSSTLSSLLKPVFVACVLEWPNLFDLLCHHCRG